MTNARSAGIKTLEVSECSVAVLALLKSLSTVVGPVDTHPRTTFVLTLKKNQKKRSSDHEKREVDENQF